MPNRFDLFLPRKVRVGPGARWTVADEAKGLAQRALVVLDDYWAKQGLAREFAERLLGVGIETVVAEPVREEPDVEFIDAAGRLGREDQCGSIISVGGGSAIDAGKGIALLLARAGSIADYQMGRRTIAHRAAGHIAIPTTAGTGAEATQVCVIHNRQEGVKRSLAHAELVPTCAILDAELTLDLPPSVTAITGIDALSHAVEPFVSTATQLWAQALARKAVELIGKALPAVLSDGGNVAARQEMLLASHLAGLALSGGVGAAHILAQPISAVCGLRHGEAIAVLLPHVIRFNMEAAGEEYATLAAAMGRPPDGEELALGIEELRAQGGVKPRLSDYGVRTEDFDGILDAVHRSTSHIATNPRPASDEDLLELLGCAL